MTATAAAQPDIVPANGNQPVKDLYEIGEIPPLGHVPAKMHALREIGSFVPAEEDNRPLPF